MTTTVQHIRLSDYKVDGVFDFGSRTRGIAVRTESKIDRYVADTNCKHINIVVPEEVYSMSRSFLREFLKNAIVKLGHDQFFKKVNFIPEGRYNVKAAVETVVEDVLETTVA